MIIVTKINKTRKDEEEKEMTVELVKEMVKMRMNRIEEIMDESTNEISQRYAMGYEELEKLLVNIEIMEVKEAK